MSRQPYNWKRFWCPRTGSINLADGGYLSDPDAEWGKAYNPDLVTLEEISSVPCLVLLGEPGIGKSQELSKLKALTEEKILDAAHVLALNLRSCTNLKDDLFKDEIFLDWLESSHSLYLFLDSLDEGILSLPTLSTGLIDELQKTKYKNHLHRLYIRIACRTFVFPEILEKGLKELWQENQVGIYELVPLRRVDIASAARDESFSPEKFLEEISQNYVIPLAIKPITLRFLLNTYRKHNGKFPPDQKNHDLYLEGCKLLCEEISPSRRASNRLGDLDSDQRLIVAARIAAITIFTNRFSIWTEIDQGEVPVEDVHLQALWFGHEKVKGRGFEVNRKVIEEVLDTGLFSSCGLNRMGWAHQTYAEFLAAWYLAQHDLSLDKIRKIIFSTQDSDRKLIPQLHETVAWLASMRSKDILKEVVETDPDILLQTDVPTDSAVRASIVGNLLTQYEQGKIFDRGEGGYHKYVRLKHSGLSDQLRSYICDSTKLLDARELAIDIAEVCEVFELQEDLVNVALDASQSIHLRVSATKAIGSLGDVESKLKLKPLAFQELKEDDSDRLKGAVLDALWPTHLETQEVFRVLARPKKRNFYGTYQYFIDHDLAKNLQPEDLELALEWLEKQGVRCFGHPFESLGNSILLEAWEYFDLDGVAESFTKVALVQWKEHQKIITRDNKLQEEFASLILNDSIKRQALVEKAVLIASTTEEDPFFLCSSLTDDILFPEDVFWMIEKLRESNDKNIQKNWAQLILWNFDRQDTRQISEIIIAARTIEVLKEVFSPHLTPVEILSDQADKMRAEFLRIQEMRDHSQQRSLLKPAPQDRIKYYLERLEGGELSAWWQLNMEMTLKSNSQHYGDEFDIDLTNLPGWKEADEVTRTRIIEGAKKYIQEQDDLDYEWIGTNTFNRPSVAGCKALHLLLNQEADLISQLSPEKWKAWAPIIVAYPSSNQHRETYLELVKLVYLYAPQKSVCILLKIITLESREHEYLFVIDRLEKCWDEQLMVAFLEKAKDSTLAPKCFGQLLEKLLQQEFDPAKEYAKSLVGLPLSVDEHEKERILIAARVLVENSDVSGWSFIWSLIQESQEFGREVIERVAYRFPSGLQLSMTEKQIADLYAWMVRQYPYDQDPDHSNEVMAYDVTTRDSVARLRDSLLSQLKERGTPKSCSEIQLLIQTFPELEWLRKTLISAKANMRRITWQPLTPKKFLQLVITQEPSNLDLSNQLSTMEKKMEDEPKVKNEINISNSPNSPINAPVGTSGITNSHVTVSNPDTKEGINWGILLAVIGIIVSVLVSGAFNEEFRKGINRMFSPQVEKESTP